MGSCGYSFGNRAAAMLIQRLSLALGEVPVSFMLTRFQRLPIEKGNFLLQNGAVTCYVHIMGGDERQPEQVVRTACADAAPPGRMPPVEHVALFELMGRRLQDVFA